MDIKKIEKPWGHELIWANTEKYVGKMLYIEKGHKLSRQYHKIKDETIFVQTGIDTYVLGAHLLLCELFDFANSTWGFLLKSYTM